MNLPALCNNIFPHFLIFSSNVSPLVYYAHIPSILIAIFFGFFILFKDRKNPVNKTLFFTLLLAAVWMIFSIIFWASNRSDIIMFDWAVTILIEPLVYIGAFYLIYLLVCKKDMSFNTKLIIGLLYLPVVIFTPTHYTLTGFDLSSCLSTEGFFGYYDYIIEFVFTFWFLILAIIKYRQSIDILFKKQILYITTGVFLFLFAFSWGNIISSFTDNWQMSLIGLFSLPVFIGFLVYSIVQYKTFSIKLLGAQALVIALAVLIAAQFIFMTARVNMVLNASTLILVIIFGYLLIRSVKREIKLREEVEQLASQRESFIHFLGHEVKGILGKNKDMFALLLDKNSGADQLQVDSFMKHSLVDTREAVEMVENLLRSDDVKNGKIPMNMKPFDMKDAVAEAIDNIRIDFEMKGLVIKKEVNENVPYMVLGDYENITKHVIHNLIDNAIRYTPKGEVTISLEKMAGYVLFTIRDEGIGISPEDMKVLFTEGGNGKNSVKVNVHSTGYGLFFAKAIVDSHQGKIWADSKGEGKGSTFYFELKEI